eukprot:CAMPEP_0172585256 /NCGR_PEP_ID=MMETSP1068-20121228/4678_1 /TAXON_ID=35684 /ORGANISM="Pseudopedinella elastica, Strain CCMP716" /LENGTH=463 /DNA_ID=CAMNT_0013379643 /DNA_START=126 /DNA_END=1518 /DNA_ORIENTATION=-
MSVLLIGAAEAALVSKAPGKKKKTRPLQVVPFEPWKPAWPRLTKSNRTHLPFANGTNCLGILTAGKLRTFNWPGVWQSHAAFLKPPGHVCVDHFLCVGEGPGEAPIDDAVAAMGLRVLAFKSTSQRDRLRQCWLKASYERHQAGMPPHGWFLRNRPDSIFFGPIPWPEDPAARFRETLSSPKDAVYAPFTDARLVQTLTSLRNPTFASNLARAAAPPSNSRGGDDAGGHEPPSLPGGGEAPTVYNTDFVDPRLACCGQTGADKCGEFLRHGGYFEAGGAGGLSAAPAKSKSKDAAKRRRARLSAGREAARPCATVSDQLALVPARFARAYFDPGSMVKVSGPRGPAPGKVARPPETEPAWASGRCGGWIEGPEAEVAAAKARGIVGFDAKSAGGHFMTAEGVLSYALAKAGARVRPLGANYTIDPRRIRAFDEARMTTQEVSGGTGQAPMAMLPGVFQDTGGP